jgi:hypothetical protein
MAHRPEGGSRRVEYGLISPRLLYRGSGLAQNRFWRHHSVCSWASTTSAHGTERGRTLAASRLSIGARDADATRTSMLATEWCLPPARPLRSPCGNILSQSRLRTRAGDTENSRSQLSCRGAMSALAVDPEGRADED